MSDNVLNEILQWSASLPAWQRDALRRVFTVGGIDAADLDDLVNLCKSAHGLHEALTPSPLTNEHLAIGDATVVPVWLRSITHHRGVNALAPEQTVTFGSQLTVVYGQNAAGKSGYTRILKKACRSRSSEDILGNVLADGTPMKGQATIRFRAGEVDDSKAWNPEAAPASALAAVSVFDAQCAPVYLREKTDVAFRPFSLDVFDRLSSACAEVKKRLENEQKLLSDAKPDLPTGEAGTKVAALLTNLTSLTKPEDVRALATLSATDEERLKVLVAKQRDLQASDPKKRAGELDAMASRFETIASHLNRLVAILGDAGLEFIRTAAVKREVAQAALAHLRTTVLTPDLLPATGEEAWRKMWDAAGEYSQLAYPGGDYPVTSDKAKCVLCQQPLGEDAVSRFKHFKELVESRAQGEVRAADAAYSTVVRLVSDAVIEREDVSAAIGELRGEDEGLANRVQTCLDEMSGNKQAVERALSEGRPLLASGTPSSPEPEVRVLAKRLRERATELRKQAPALGPGEATELKELGARVTLKERFESVLGEIERRKHQAAYALCVDDTGTQAITRKSTDLTKRLITERLSQEFQNELGKMEFAHLAVEIKAAGGARGALFHQLVFSNAPGVVVAKVLSEGESRTLSLASFLAELSTAPAPSAIIFDDPVSSLDHVWRERIARRLVLEAKTRQVIVFTHDLLFLKLLLEGAEQQGVGCQNQYVRRGSDASGLVSADLPWVAMRVKDRLGVLRQRWQAAEKLSRTGDSDGYERDAREIYALIRETWEQATGEVLLHDVIERYRPSIETQRVRVLHDITEEDCTAVDTGMSECSRWMLGHDHPPADGSPFPQPAELCKRIDELEEWVQRIRKRREATKPGRAGGSA